MGNSLSSVREPALWTSLHAGEVFCCSLLSHTCRKLDSIKGIGSKGCGVLKGLLRKCEILTERGKNGAKQLAGLLELVATSGDLVRAAEVHGVRGWLQEFATVWEDLEVTAPELKNKQRYRVEQSAFALKVAGFQELVSEVLTSNGIRFLGLKGLSLSQLLYGDICRREFGDLDVLVAPPDALRAIRILEQNGFARTYPNDFSPSQDLALVRYGKAQNFYRRASSLSLDLHWKLLSAWIGDGLFGFGELWERSQELERQGMTNWRTLGAEDTLVFLALHGYQDGFPRLKQLLDLSQAMESLEYNLEKTLEIAGPRAALVDRAVELVGWLMDTRDAGTHFSCREQALESWLQMATKDKTPQSNLLRFELWSCSWWEAARRSAKALMTPAVDDLASLSLPSPLIGLYPLVRAFRLMKKALERGSSGGSLRRLTSA